MFCGAFTEKYQSFISKGEISSDAFQIDIIRRLEHKIVEFPHHHRNWQTGQASVKYSLATTDNKVKSAEDDFLGRKKLKEQGTFTLLSSPFTAQFGKGFYLWGKSGCGKTFMSELFFDCLPALAPQKKKMHFNEFMISVHRRSFEFLQKKLPDPLFQFAREFSTETCALYVDEFQVTDIADASILQRLFSLLWSFGVLLFTSSNREPETLYYNGIQREKFLPFIPLLKTHCDVLALASPKNYREEMVFAELKKSEDRVQTYLYPLSTEAQEALHGLFLRFTGGNQPRKVDIEVLAGRSLALSGWGDVLWASFAQLVLQQMGPNEYIAICRHFRVIFIHSVPRISKNEENICRRLIWLIDQVYNYRVKLFVEAERPFDELLEYNEHGQTDADLEIKRCISRIKETQTEKYLQKPHRTA